MTITQIVKEQIIQVATDNCFVYDKKNNHFYRKITDAFYDSVYVQYFPDTFRKDWVSIEIFIGIHIHRMYELICNLYEEPVDNNGRWPQVKSDLLELTGNLNLTFSLNDDIQQFNDRLDKLFQETFEPWFQDMHSWKNIRSNILKNRYWPSVVTTMHYFNGDKKKGLKLATQYLNYIEESRRLPRDYSFVENFAKLPPYKGDFNEDMMK